MIRPDATLEGRPIWLTENAKKYVFRRNANMNALNQSIKVYELEKTGGKGELLEIAGNYEHLKTIVLGYNVPVIAVGMMDETENVFYPEDFKDNPSN